MMNNAVSRVPPWRRTGRWLLGVALASLCVTASGISMNPLPADGAGGAASGHFFEIGGDTVVAELDAYLGIAGEDLNGGLFGTTVQLSLDPLPAGLSFTIAQQLSPGATDLLLRYTFTNNTGADLSGLEFFSFLDADIAPGVNTTFNEYAELLGVPAPDNGFEVDTPAGTFPEIIDHLLLGQLDDGNAFPDPQQTGDVSMALSVYLGDLLDGDSTGVEVLISEIGSSLGGLTLVQHDVPGAAQASPTQVTYSAALSASATPLPLPSPLLLVLAGAVVLIRGGEVRAARRQPTR